MKEITFYTRSGCCLCDDAKNILKLINQDIPFLLNEVDIDESDELTERFGIMIPVIEINEEIIQYGQIDYFSLSKRLQEKS